MKKTVEPAPQSAAPPPQPPAAYGAASMVDLEPSISWSRCECLNSAAKGGMQNVLKQGYRDQEGLLCAA